MIPIHDNIPTESRPYANYLLIILCALVFLLQWSLGDQAGELVERFAMVPLRIAGPEEPILVPELAVVQTARGPLAVEVTREMSPAAVPEWLTLVTSMFLHGGWMHVLGNLWFLHIFGDKVEDRLGKPLYLITYFGCGLIAALAHLITNFASPVPTIGASGAIAGVMGAYLVLFPHARVLTLVPLFFLIQFIEIPAAIFLGIWFLIQFFNGAFTILDVQAGGVAWWAHIGGFAAGALVGLGLKTFRPPLDPSSTLSTKVAR